MGCVWPLRSGLQPSTLFSLADTRFTAPAWHGGELRRHTRPTSAQLSPAHLYCWLRLKCADTPPPPLRVVRRERKVTARCSLLHIQLRPASLACPGSQAARQPVCGRRVHGEDPLPARLPLQAAQGAPARGSGAARPAPAARRSRLGRSAAGAARGRPLRSGSRLRGRARRLQGCQGRQGAPLHFLRVVCAQGGCVACCSALCVRRGGVCQLMTTSLNVMSTGRAS